MSAQNIARMVVGTAGIVVLGLAMAMAGSGHADVSTLAPAAACAVALVLVGLGRVGPPAALAFVAAAWSVCVVGHVVFAMNPLLDTLGESSAPRPAVMVPATLALAGVGLLHYPLLPLGTALCGVCVVVIGTLQTMLALSSGLATAIVFHPAHVAPLPMALALVVLGAGVMATPLIRPTSTRRHGYTWAPLAAMLLLAMGSAVLWRALVYVQMGELARLTRSAATVLREHLVHDVTALGAVLEVLAAEPGEPRVAWADEIEVLRRTSPGLLALSAANADLTTRARVWLAADRIEPPDLRAEDHALLARTTPGRFALTHVQARSDGRPVARIAFPEGDGGFVMATIDVGELTARRISTLQDYAVRLVANETPIFERDEEAVAWHDAAVQRRVLVMPGGTEWTLLVSPSRALRRSTRTVLPEIVLLASLLLAVLLGATLRLARNAALQAETLAREVVQRQRAEDELRAMAVDLERRVQDRTEELRAANTSLGQENAMRRRADVNLRRSNEDLRQFAAFVSHELRQPLSTIGIWAELLENGDPPLTEKQQRHLGKIRASVVRMSKLIESELALAQVSRAELPNESVDLTKVLGEVRREVTPLLEEADGRLEFGPLSVVTGDPQQLRLLFRNLVENAVKHRREQPPLVRVDERNPDDPDTCTIEVRDNGREFPPDTAERMFTIFDRSADGAVPGASIGLAICRRIVERHGGRITALANDGPGVRFVIELPRAGEAGPPPDVTDGTAGRLRATSAARSSDRC